MRPRWTTTRRPRPHSAFFAAVRNKLHYAVHGQTAAEVIVDRADAEQPHMGLTTWEGAPKGKIHRYDVVIAKNYLSATEMDQMQRIVSAYLDMAEMQATRRIPMTMADWEARLAGFLRLLDEHWKLEQVDQIERLAETWVSFYPGGTWLGRTRFALGEHYYRNRDLLRAERYLSAIAPDDSLGAHALAMRARLHDEAGDKAGALALYETLATLDPGPYQLRGLARTADLQFQSGEVDSALAAYRVIETSAPECTPVPEMVTGSEIVV